MSEPMEVKVEGQWHPVDYIGKPFKGWTIVVWGDGTRLIYLADLERATRLRPAPKPEAKVEADGWCVKYYEDGLYSVRRFRNRRCVDALSPHGTIITVDEWIKGSYEDTLFRSEAAARSALATWREKQAAKPAPSPLTAEQEAAVREIVRDVMNAPTFEARSV